MLASCQFSASYFSQPTNQQFIFCSVERIAIWTLQNSSGVWARLAVSLSMKIAVHTLIKFGKLDRQLYSKITQHSTLHIWQVRNKKTKVAMHRHLRTRGLERGCSNFIQATQFFGQSLFMQQLAAKNEEKPFFLFLIQEKKNSFCPASGDLKCLQTAKGLVDRRVD